MLLRFLSNPKIQLNALIIGTVILLVTFQDSVFSPLALERDKVHQGEVWRLLTGNFVHFGWAHSLMNLAGFLIFSFTFTQELSTRKLGELFLFCPIAVGLCIYAFNPEYTTYAGLSGAIHGFFVAGLILNKRHSLRFNFILVLALFAKIVIELQPNYQGTELHSLIPVPVAHEAHLYGALSGLGYGIFYLLLARYSKTHPSN